MVTPNPLHSSTVANYLILWSHTVATWNPSILHGIRIVKKVEPDNSNGSCEAAFKNAQEDPNRRLHETLPAMYAQWWANNQQAELENHLAEQDEFEIVATSINRKRNSSHLSEDMEQAVADDKATSIWKKNSRGINRSRIFFLNSDLYCGLISRQRKML